MKWEHTAGSLLMFMVWDDYPEEKRSRSTCPPVEVWILTILSFLP